MECLDANVVQDLMAGALTASAKATAIQHLDGCGDCRDLLGALARDATRDAALDTLNDTEKRAPNVSMMDTLDNNVNTLVLINVSDGKQETEAFLLIPCSKLLRYQRPSANLHV